MITDLNEKLELCLAEMRCMVEMAATSHCDDTCGRLLCTYAAVRMDDFTKMLGQCVAADDDRRQRAVELKELYNHSLRKFRDKFGAHCQGVGEGADLGARLSLYASVDFDDVRLLVEGALGAYTAMTDRPAPAPVAQMADAQKIEAVLGRLHHGDVAALAVDALGLVTANCGGLFTCSQAQQRGQILRSLQWLVRLARAFVEPAYEAVEVGRMFRRLLVCCVMNFVDNLLTRGDIREGAVQYETGFDRLLPALLTNEEEQRDVGTAFSRMMARDRDLPVKLSRLRKVRDRSCAHLDVKSPLAVLNAMVDALDVPALLADYDTLQNVFDYVVQHTILLRPLALPPRTPLYGSRFEPVGGTGFYGRGVPALEDGPAMTPAGILHVLRKGTADSGRAAEEFRRIVMACDADDYEMRLRPLLVERLTHPSLSGEELSTLVGLLRDSRRGYPLRLQRLALDVLGVSGLRGDVVLAMLWLLSDVLLDYSDARVMALASWAARSEAVSVQVYGFWLWLKSIADSRRPVRNNVEAELPQPMVRVLQAVGPPPRRLALLVTLCSRWFFRDGAPFRAKELQRVAAALLDLAHAAFSDYAAYAKASGELREMECLLDSRRFSQLNYHLLVNEERRHQSANPFLAVFAHCALVYAPADGHERLFAALSDEWAGNLQRACDGLHLLHRDYPFDDLVVDCLRQFGELHPGLGPSFL